MYAIPSGSPKVCIPSHFYATITTEAFLTGVFLDNAQDLVAQPELTESDLKKRFTIAAEDALAAGLTKVHDAGFHPSSLALFRG